MIKDNYQHAIGVDKWRNKDAQQQIRDGQID